MTIYTRFQHHPVKIDQGLVVSGGMALNEFGDVFFVDRANGSDAANGATPDNAVATINAADDLCTTQKRDTIVFIGRVTSGQQFAASQEITKDGVRLIGGGVTYGMGGGWDSCIVNCHTATDYAGTIGPVCLRLAAEDVLVSGLKFYNPDATQAQYHIGVDDTTTDSGDGRNCAIINNVFQGQDGTANRTRGIHFCGSETGLAKHNQFYQCEYGVVLSGGPKRYANRIIVEDNHIFGSKYGIYLTNSSATDNVITRNCIMPKQTYGYAQTYGIYVADAAQGNAFIENMSADDTKSVAYHAGSGTNYWVNNYYGTSGGTLFDGSD